MRKIFFSTAKLASPERIAAFDSRDFELGDKQHVAPISYLLDANIEADDEIVIITNVMEKPNSQENYKLLKKDMDEILEKHNAKATFIVTSEPNPRNTNREEMDSLTISRYFKKLSDYFQDGDRIYADMTFGMKCNTICSLIAMSYATKAGTDIDVERMVYAELYDGDIQGQEISYIVDITSLFYINTLINNSHSGQKESIDGFLKFMIG